LEAVTRTLNVWLQDAGLPADTYDIKGGQMSKRFTVVFKGANSLAARRVKTTLAALHVNGEWPTLTATRDDHSSETIYASEDKLPSTIALERGTKALANILHDTYVGRKFFGFKKDNTIALEWKHLAVLSYSEHKKSVEIDWNKQLCASANIDFAAIEASYFALPRGRRTPWG
jgi:hypothetical protein